MNIWAYLGERIVASMDAARDEQIEAAKEHSLEDWFIKVRRAALEVFAPGHEYVYTYLRYHLWQMDVDSKRGRRKIKQDCAAWLCEIHYRKGTREIVYQTRELGWTPEHAMLLALKSIMAEAPTQPEQGKESK